MSTITAALTWKSQSPTRLVADLDDDGEENLVIDLDDTRPGRRRWYLTWYAPDQPGGVFLADGTGPESLTVFAARWWEGEE